MCVRLRVGVDSFRVDLPMFVARYVRCSSRLAQARWGAACGTVRASSANHNQVAVGCRLPCEHPIFPLRFYDEPAADVVGSMVSFQSRTLLCSGATYAVRLFRLISGQRSIAADRMQPSFCCLVDTVLNILAFFSPLVTRRWCSSAGQFSSARWSAKEAGRRVSRPEHCGAERGLGILERG